MKVKENCMKGMKERNIFLNSHVMITKADGVLYGLFLATERYGIWLKTSKETSFIAYRDIKDISLNQRYLKDD